MNRAIVYFGEQIASADVARTNIFPMVGIGKLAQAILGSSTLLNDLPCTPTSPASLSVILGTGEIYSLENVDNTAFGPIPADTANQIIKQGLLFNPATITLTAPLVSGQSIDYLLQCTYSDVDALPESRPFYLAAPQTVNTVRQGILSYQVKAGTPATTGTQVPPTPDAGYTGAWVITVDFGQTQILSGDINPYSGAPFITETLIQKISKATADTFYTSIPAIQYGSLIYGVDTGTANTVVTSLNPAVTSYQIGMTVHVKIANMNTGPATFNLNGLAVTNIVSANGMPLNPADLMPGMTAILEYNNPEWRLLNPCKNVVYFRVGLSADFSGVISTKSQIPFDQVIFDNLSLFNVSTHEYPVSIPGIYKISMSVNFSAPTSQCDRGCGIFINSSEVSSADVSTFTNASPNQSSMLCEYIAPLSVGDLISSSYSLNLANATLLKYGFLDASPAVATYLEAIRIF